MEIAAIPERQNKLMENAPKTVEVETPEASEDELRRIARVALFDTLIDYHHRGHCTFDEAVAEYKAELEVQGL